MYRRADEENEEERKYYNYTSLYLYVNKNAVYPIGHPEIVFRPGHTDVFRYFVIAMSLFYPRMACIIPCFLSGRITS